MNVSDMTDEQLLTDYLQTKKEELYNAIDERMRPRLYALGLRILKSPEDAEDIVQDVFFKLLEMKSQPDPIRSAESFLFRALWNLCIDQKRAEKTDVLHGAVSLDVFEHPELVKDDADYTGTEPRFREPPDQNSTLTESQIRARELQLEARLALENLPTTQKEAVELFHCRSMTVSEAADIVGTTETTIEMRVRRGIKNLRKALGVKAKVRKATRAVRATNESGEIIHEFPAVKDAVSAGFSSNRLYCSLNQGKPYKGLTWSYASAT
jgi:RNA polymerase sigma-70 factor (ECF subfamily)